MATWHSSNNRAFNYTAFGVGRANLNVETNTLSVGGHFFIATFEPPPGKSFANFPFDETVVLKQFSLGGGGLEEGGTCTAASFSNVRVVIDDRQATYKSFLCPDAAAARQLVGGNNAIVSCVNGVDTHTLSSGSRVGSVQTSVVRYPVYSCSPCESPNWYDTTTTTTYIPGCSQTAKTNCVQSVTKASSWPELVLNVNFQGPGIPIGEQNEGPPLTLDALSGAYALKFDPFTLASFQGGLVFPNWQSLTNVGANGHGAAVGDPFAFVGPFQPEQADQGWQITYETFLIPENAVSFGTNRRYAQLRIIVAPVKIETTINRSTKAVTWNPCGIGSIAYQVKFSVRLRDTAGFWSTFFSAYANVPCAARSCGTVPSVSLTSADAVFVPLSGSMFAPKGKLGTVSVSVSS